MDRTVSRDGATCWAHEPCGGIMAAVGNAISAAPQGYGVLVSATTGQPMALVPVEVPRCSHCGIGVPVLQTTGLYYCFHCATFSRETS
jgi:hypothetical protein